MLAATFAGGVQAATSTTTFAVTTNLQATCSTTASALAFPAYTPGAGAKTGQGSLAWGISKGSDNPRAAGVFLASSGAQFALMFDELPRRSPSGAPGTFVPVGIAAASNDVGFMRLAFASMAERPGSAAATFVAATNRGVYRSGDGGVNWYRVQLDAPAAMHSALSAVEYAPATTTLFGADRAGALWCSLDDGTTWRAAGQAGAPVVSLRALDGKLMALTDGNGVAIVAPGCP